MAKVALNKIDREEEARQEVAITAISPQSAWWLIGLFLGMILAVMGSQQILELAHGKVPQAWTVWKIAADSRRSYDAAADKPWYSRIRAGNTAAMKSIDDFETNLENDAWIHAFLLPRSQSLLSDLGAGNEKGYIGRDGWLFYRSGLESLWGRSALDPGQMAKRKKTGSDHPDPRPAIIDFYHQLQARGITLVLVPIPVKPSIHPEQFSARYANATAPLLNPGHDQLMADLRSAGVTVVDPAALLWQRRQNGAAAQYLQTDTHWRPEAMQAVADDVAEAILSSGAVTTGSLDAHLEPQTISTHGDITVMLTLPEGQTAYPPETVTLQRVIAASGSVAREATPEQVLILGDSFSNIYHLEQMHWGTDAGFAEHIAYALRQPVATLLRNDGGSHVSREQLRVQILQGRIDLSTTKVVVWAFAAREFAVGNWPVIALPETPTTADPKAIVRSSATPEWLNADGKTHVVRGKIAAMGAVVEPGKIDYKDHLVDMHLMDLKNEDGTPLAGNAFMKGQDLIDGKTTAVARLRVGDTVTLRLVSYDTVVDHVAGFKEDILDDMDIILNDIWWIQGVIP